MEDLARQESQGVIATLGKPLLILHSPIDAVVGIDNAAEIYGHAKHPKSFISLDRADHMLSRREDAAYASSIIATWSARYLDAPR